MVRESKNREGTVKGNGLWRHYNLGPMKSPQALNTCEPWASASMGVAETARVDLLEFYTVTGE
ncbi:unnamed protein product [Sphenostylis stenocarpa]|uniref:Uncharacterized protein n=1 Tax=Sphenostylis stenocarpa TaxID=92480 RepID=A0AA86TL00_9FABA|nr:unnamed protein product [Sphenostylis stenocarpa]